MAGENRLPIEIEVKVSQGSVERSLADIERSVSQKGRKIGQSLSSIIAEATRFDGPQSGIEAFKKSLDSIYAVGKQKAAAGKLLGQEWGKQFRAGLDEQLGGKSAKDSASVFAQAFKAQDAQAKLAGIAWGEQFRAGLGTNLSGKSAKDSASVFAQAFKDQAAISKMPVGGYTSAVSEIRRVLDLEKQKSKELAKHIGLIEGIQNRLQKIALLTTELTRAFFGISAIIAGIGAPVIFGIKFMKDIEDAKMGISGTLLSMGMLTKQAMTTADAMAMSDIIISKLEKDSLKYNVSLADTSKLFQAIVGPGLAARMTLDQIAKTAVIGAVAVKSMGLDSRQVVQEVRDLVQGGIQAASSTLATALGLKDSDIKKAKESSEGLFVFLEKRMIGFAMMSAERSNTLLGAWDMLWMKVQRLFADETGFQAIKNVIKDISDSIGKIDANGNLALNPELVSTMKQYWKTIGDIASEFTRLAQIVIKVGSYAGEAFRAFEMFLLGALAAQILKVYASLVTVTGGVVGLTAAMTTLQTRIAAMGVATRGGLLGIALWGGYELADNLGIIDKLFSTFESRVARLQGSMARSSSTNLKERLEDLQSEVGMMRNKKDDKGNFVGFRRESDLSLFEQNRLRQIKEERVAINRQLDIALTREQRANDISQRGATIMQGIRAAGELKTEYEKEDPIAKRTNAIADANAKLKDALVGIGTSMQQGTLEYKDGYVQMLEVTKYYNTAIAQANKPTKSEKASREKSWFEKQMDSLKLATEAAQERLDKLKGTFIGTQLPSVKVEALIKQHDIKLGAKPLSKTEKASARAEATEQERILRQGDVLEGWNKISEVSAIAANSTRDYTNALAEATEQERIKREIVGKSDFEVELLKLEYATQKEINKELDRKNKFLQDNKNLTAAQIADVEFLAATNIFVIERESAARKKAIEERKVYEESFKGGAEAAFEEYSKNALTAAGAAREAFLGAFRAMEDGLVEFVKTGKLSFGSFVNTVIDGLIRMAARAAITNIGEMIMGSTKSGSGPGEFMSAAFTATKSFLGFKDGAAFGNVAKFAKGAAFSAALATSPMAFANGGAFTNGIYDKPTAFQFANGGKFNLGVMGEGSRAEAVMPLERGPQGLGVINYGGPGGQTVMINVEVNVDSSGNATSSTDASGIGQGLGDVLGAKIKQVILDEQRPGGSLNRGR